MEVYGESMELFGITQKYLDTRARTWIRKKAIVSFDPVWKGGRFHTPESCLNLIGQEGRSEKLDTVEKTPLTLQNTEIVTSETSALCVSLTNNTVRQVKPQSGRKRKGAGKTLLRSHFLKKVKNESYSKRLTLLSVTCVSWSVSFDGCTLLSVGTTSGHILFWKLTAAEVQDGDDLSEHFCSLGCRKVSESGISVIEWIDLSSLDGASATEKLILCVGDSNGEVKLWALHTEAVMSSGSESLLQESALICPSDLCQISCLRTSLVPASSGSYCLRIYVGKYAGGLAIWQSPELTETPSLDWAVEHGELASLTGIHGSKAVTGIVDSPFLDMILTSGLDSTLCSWRLEQGGIVPCSSGICQFLNGLNFQPIYGMALSPSGSLLAVVRDLGEKYRDAQSQRMVWKRVAHGALELHSLVDFDQAAAWAQLTEHLKKRLHRGADPIVMEDVGHLIHLALTEDKSGAQEDEEALEEPPEGEAAAEDAADLKMEVDETDLSTSERQSYAVTLVESLLEDFKRGGMEWNPKVRRSDLLRWRAINALYHTIEHLPGMAFMETWSKRAELSLLEHHVMTTLSLGAAAKRDLRAMEQDPSEIQQRMVQWTSEFGTRLHPALTQKSKQSRFKHSMTEHEFSQSEDPVEAATQSQLSIDDVQMELSRCPVSFGVIEEALERLLKCRICQRQYLMQPSALDAAADDWYLCLFCGVPLRHYP